MLDSGVRPLLSLPVVLGMAVQRDTGMKQRKVRLMEVFVPPPRFRVVLERSYLHT